ncbi:MAG: hypothetical protein RLW68_00760 [Devosia marina]|uniref:hypothetical protein n=1 Tax=Devosia marina TaxID=2683198 RepID=UPI0032EE4CB6
MRDTTLGTVTGTAGLTFPWWNEAVHFATGANQFLIALLGLIVLILTARKLWIDNQIAARRLRDLGKEQ